MKMRIFGLLTMTALVHCLLGSAQTLAQNAYIANSGSNNVSVINTRTNKVVATIPVGNEPFGVATSPDGSRIYVTNSSNVSVIEFLPGTVSVIDTAKNTVIAPDRQPVLSRSSRNP